MDKNKNKMQYKVPQDVQREDTIIGPITLKQLGILGIGGFIVYAIYMSLAKAYFIEIWLPPVAIVAALTLAFAFLKIYDLPFHKFLMCFLEFNLLAKKRIWIQGTATPFISSFEDKKEEPKKEEVVQQKKQKSLEELTHIVDTHGGSEISKEDKKEGLKEIINQNYKN